MTATHMHGRTLRRYLLGLASEEEVETIERRYLAREEALGDVEEAEQDVIDAFLSGRLAADERARFETHYLASPRHRERVAFARAIRLRSAPVRRRLPFAPLAVAASILIAFGLGSILYLSLGPERGRTVSLILPALLERGENGAETPTARIDAGAMTVELRLERGPMMENGASEGHASETPATSSPTPASPLRVVLRTVEGEEIWRGLARPPGDEGASPPRRMIATVAVPAARLATGDYVVVLSDPARGEDLQQYYFRAVRR